MANCIIFHETLKASEAATFCMDFKGDISSSRQEPALSVRTLDIINNHIIYIEQISHNKNTETWH